MGGGKGSAPTPPDYTPIAQSSLDAAKVQAQTSADQLDWAKQQYADQKPLTDAFMQSMVGVQNTDIQAQQQAMASGQKVSDAELQAMQTQQAQAQQAQDYYKSTYQPIESQFAATAQGYNTPQRAEQQSAAAQADVATAFSGQRQAALQSLESYGIDPSQTRYGALDLGTRISQAAAQSAAGTQSRLNTEATGLALQGEAINIGRGYPGQIAQAYSTATQAGQGVGSAYGGAIGAGAGAAGAGSAGIGAGLNTANTYGNMMGTPTQWSGLANQSTAQGINAYNTGFQNQMAGFNANTAIAQNQMSGIGGLAGAAIGAGAIAIAV